MTNGSTKSGPSKGGRLVRLLPPLLGVLASLLVCNLLAGLLIMKMTGVHDDPVLGQVRNPGLVIWGSEGYAWLTLNSIGLRAPEPGTVTSSTTDVLFLGDSYTEAWQVFDGQTFPQMIQARLSRQVLGIRSINAGIAGSSPASYIGRAGFYDRVYQPAATVVQLSEGDFGGDLFDGSHNFFYLRRHGSSFALATNPVFDQVGRLARIFPQVVALRPVLDLPVIRAGLDNFSKSEEARQADGSASTTTTTGADQVLVDWVLNQLKERYPGLVILWIPYDRATPYEMAVAAACRRLSIPFVDPRLDFDAADRHGVPARGFDNTIPGAGHLNATGHSVIASELAPVVARRLSR